tara:strand:- start:237 stop:725 length:489 start_codon:yes stop_codon:yes gene_type:complete
MMHQSSLSAGPDNLNCWFSLLRRYLIFSAAANLLWETFHLPLYTVWQDGTINEIFIAAVHCTMADLVIALCCLIIAILFLGNRQWPVLTFTPVLYATLALGVAYTTYSEWNNVYVLQTWAYSELMPIVPIIEIGFSPIAQWIFIPLFGLIWARRGLPTGVSL